MSEAEPTRCSECGDVLVMWSYYAHAGDLMFRHPTNVPLVMVDGSGEEYTGACLVCPDCDLIARFPRRA